RVNSRYYKNEFSVKNRLNDRNICCIYEHIWSFRFRPECTNIVNWKSRLARSASYLGSAHYYSFTRLATTTTDRKSTRLNSSHVSPLALHYALPILLIPGIIKMNFPLKIGLMTGIYAVFMNIFGALGSGLSVPISSIGNLGWRGALAIWGVLTIIALLVWLPQL